MTCFKKWSCRFKIPVGFRCLLSCPCGQWSQDDKPEEASLADAWWVLRITRGISKPRKAWTMTSEPLGGRPGCQNSESSPRDTHGQSGLGTPGVKIFSSIFWVGKAEAPPWEWFILVLLELRYEVWPSDPASLLTPQPKYLVIAQIFKHNWKKKPTRTAYWPQCTAGMTTLKAKTWGASGCWGALGCWGAYGTVHQSCHMGNTCSRLIEEAAASGQPVLLDMFPRGSWAYF